MPKYPFRVPREESNLVSFFTRQAGLLIRNRSRPWHLKRAIELAFSHHFHEPVLNALRAILDDPNRSDVHYPLLKAVSEVTSPEHRVPIYNFFLDLTSHANPEIANLVVYHFSPEHAESLVKGFGRREFSRFLISRGTRAAKKKILSAYRYFGRNFADLDTSEDMERYEWIMLHHEYQKALFKSRPRTQRTLYRVLCFLRSGLPENLRSKLWTRRDRQNVCAKLWMEGATRATINRLLSEGVHQKILDSLKKEGVTQSTLGELSRMGLHRDVLRVLRNGASNVLGLVLVGSHARGSGRKYKEMDLRLTVADGASPNSVRTRVQNYHAALKEILYLHGHTAEDLSRMRWINLERPESSFFPILHAPFVYFGIGDLSRAHWGPVDGRRLNELFWNQVEEHARRTPDQIR